MVKNHRISKIRRWIRNKIKKSKKKKRILIKSKSKKERMKTGR